MCLVVELTQYSVYYLWGGIEVGVFVGTDWSMLSKAEATLTYVINKISSK